MARSFDRRKHPAGPLAGPDERSLMRGVKRAVVGRVTPGDDVEVSREIERLWEWHNRLWRNNARLTELIQRLIDRTGPLIPGFDITPSEYPDADFLGGTATFAATSCTPNSPVVLIPSAANNGSLSVGRYRANYASGYRLMVAVTTQFSDIDQVSFATTPGSGTGSCNEFIADVSFHSGGLTYTTTWAVFAGDGASLQYGQSVDLTMAISTNLGFSSGGIGAGTIVWKWVPVAQAQDDSSAPGEPLPIPTAGAANSPGILTWNPTLHEWEYDATPDVNAYLGFRQNAGTTYLRHRLNFIDGYGVDLTVADDAANDEVDFTVAVDPSEIDVKTFSGYDGSALKFLAGDATFRTVGGRFNGLLYGTPALGTTRYIIVPRAADDTDATFDLERIRIRTETPSSSGSVVGKLQKATGGGALTWVDVVTLTLPVSTYEAQATIGVDTLTSDDLLRFYFTSIGTGVTDYQVLVTGARTS